MTEDLPPDRATTDPARSARPPKSPRPRPPASARATVRVQLLTAGVCRHLERVVRRGGAWRAVDLPALAVLIEHPAAGAMLFDTGYSPRFHAQTAHWPQAAYRHLTPVLCGPDDTVAAQLRACGRDPGEIVTVVLSHLHADHVGGARDLSAAVFRHGAGASDPLGLGPVRQVAHGVLAGLLPDDFAARSRALSDDEVVEVPWPVADPARVLGGPGPSGGADAWWRTGHDLTGDGSVIAVALPGHTRGHVGLLLPGVGPAGLLLVGDACWSRRAFTHDEAPLGVVRLITHDPRTGRDVVAALGRLQRAAPDLLIVPSHCADSIDAARAVLAAEQP